MRSLKSRGGLTRGKGFTFNVRMMWVSTMHFCSSVHSAMAALTNHAHTTSDQHKELGKTRIMRDYTDLNKMIDFFSTHNPFDLKRESLQSLSTGLIANGNINCDDAEEIGRNIHIKLDNTLYGAELIKKKDLVITL